MYKETVIKDAFLISTVNMSSTESGILLCNARNEYGNATHTSDIFMTGKIVFFFFNLYTIYFTIILCSFLHVKILF